MNKFTSAFAPKLISMLEYRTARGFKPRTHLGKLLRFDKFCAERYPDSTELTAEIVYDWLETETVLSPRMLNERASTIRQLGLYLSAIDEKAFVLTEKFCTNRNRNMLEFHRDVPMISDTPLFYAVAHGVKHPLTDRRVRYLLKQYADRAREVCIEVPENVHPHMFRHNRAMHLYQNGMDFTLISEWLGHANLETTQIYYAHADTEHKRTAIAKATPENSRLFSKLNSDRLTVTDEETLKRLTGLRN